MSKTTNYDFDKQKWGHQIREDDLNRIAANLDLIDAAIASRPSAATLVVAASDSLHKERADYVCPGVDDQVVIQAVIDALPSGGGTVVLLDGHFSCLSQVSRNINDVFIKGQGISTVLEYNGIDSIFEITTQKGWSFSDLNTDSGGFPSYVILNNCFKNGIRIEDNTMRGTVVKDAAWTWWQNPRAIRYTGIYDKTYIGYTNTSGDIMIASYDYNRHEIFTYTLHAALQIDDHNAPAILIRRSDQRIIVFYSKHVTGNKMYYRISNNPEDISSFGPEQFFTSASYVTYPNPIDWVGDNKIYVFYRRGNIFGSYRRSADGGITWEAEIDLLSGSWLYQLVKEGKTTINNTIEFVISDHPLGAINHDINYFYLKMDGGVLKAYNFEGLIKAEGDFPLIETDLSLIYDVSVEGNFAVRAFDFVPFNNILVPTRHFTVAFCVHPIDSSAVDTEYWYLQRRHIDGDWGWIKGKITDTGGGITSNPASSYVGCMCSNNLDDDIIYISKGIDNKQWIIQKAAITVLIPVDVSYNSPESFPSGLTYDGTNIWSCDSLENKIYKHNVDMTINATYNGLGISIKGLAYDGTRIWSCGKEAGGKIWKHNADMTENVEYAAPAGNPSGLTWDGTRIWSCDSVEDKIYKHNVDMSIDTSYHFPGTTIVGLTWDGTRIWSCDLGVEKIRIHAVIDMAVDLEYPSPMERVYGLTYDGTNIWSCDAAEGKIYKHNVEQTSTILETISGSGKNIRPITIINHGSESPVIWLSSIKFDDYTTGFNHDLVTPFDLSNIVTSGIRYMSSLLDLFMDVLAVSATHVRSNEDLSAATPITFTIDAQPDIPRTLSAHFDTHANITAYTIAIIGIDAKGNTVSELKTETDGWDWETNNAFATITSIKMTSRTGTGAGDTMDIGITDVLGLSNIIYAIGDVFKIKKNNANAAVATAQVNTTYDTYDMAVIGLAGGDDFTIWFKSNLNIIP